MVINGLYKYFLATIVIASAFGDTTTIGAALGGGTPSNNIVTVVPLAPTGTSNSTGLSSGLPTGLLGTANNILGDDGVAVAEEIVANTYNTTYELSENTYGVGMPVGTDPYTPKVPTNNNGGGDSELPGSSEDLLNFSNNGGATAGAINSIATGSGDVGAGLSQKNITKHFLNSPTSLAGTSETAMQRTVTGLTSAEGSRQSALALQEPVMAQVSHSVNTQTGFNILSNDIRNVRAEVAKSNQSPGLRRVTAAQDNCKVLLANGFGETPFIGNIGAGDIDTATLVCSALENTTQMLSARGGYIDSAGGESLVTVAFRPFDDTRPFWYNSLPQNFSAIKFFQTFFGDKYIKAEFEANAGGGGLGATLAGFISTRKEEIAAPTQPLEMVAAAKTVKLAEVVNTDIASTFENKKIWSIPKETLAKVSANPSCPLSHGLIADLALLDGGKTGLRDGYVNTIIQLGALGFAHQICTIGYDLAERAKANTALTTDELEQLRGLVDAQCSAIVARAKKSITCEHLENFTASVAREANNIRELNAARTVTPQTPRDAHFADGYGAATTLPTTPDSGFGVGGAPMFNNFGGGPN